ncbi:flippase-like domain-containing protein [Chryseobacterium sp. MFBS3-17]|nr:lysylphosphatidylglycerol synthase transmembrane domain-containing protein [Chryseobacterium sp. MFBS3-17]MCC2590811.1 flippase-like domain-containing protein [Chryseobacterium sp. MFBS3-17]
MNEAKKNNPLKTVMTIVLSLGIAAFFMWFALRGMDFKTISGYFAKANYFWVVAATVFGLLAYWFRAVRWNLLLEPMGYKISNANAFWTISFGYLMNLTIPRSGELARSTALYGVEKVPVDKSFGTIILERVIDLVCMVGFLGLTLLFKYDAILSFYSYVTQEQKKEVSTEQGFLEQLLAGWGIADVSAFFNTIKIALVILAIVGLGYIFVKKKSSFVSFANGILHGITSIFKLKQKGKFILLSLAIWICYYFAAYLVCFSLPETSEFSIADGFFIIVVGTLGMMVPASGGIGAFHAALKLGIGALFLSMGKTFEEGAEAGLAYAFISHTMQFVIMLVVGVISVPFLTKARNKMLSSEKI